MSEVQQFGVTGDGVTDDTDNIQHAIDNADGRVTFPRGVYRITRPIVIDLDRRDRTGIDGSNGTAKIVMDGPGPALRIIGTHEGTGDPLSFKPNVWTKQRMPTLTNIEIEGRHAEADGVELTGTMQATLEGVLIRRCRHGVHLVKRNRNVIISHCHIYHNTGVGVFLEDLNLHQINIASSHISYNRLGGIRIERSEVRNLQITGNDIEYNNDRVHKLGNEPSAEIYVDTTAPGASVAEVTIASNTIQATDMPGGCNIRVIGSLDQTNPPGLWTIACNIIGSQDTNVHLTECVGFAITGNFIYSCLNRNLLLERCRQMTVASNNFRRHTPKMNMGVRLVECEDCLINGCNLFDEHETGQPTGASPLELVRCNRVNVTGCQVLNGVPFGVDVDTCSVINMTGNTIVDKREKPVMKRPIRWIGNGTQNLMSGNTIPDGADGGVAIGNEAGVTLRP
ncbi:MAG: hypothetical protein GC159_01300 [Phycisphaera sp.]|nr:hypothetical protein [Phycisphaera sp.]